jgi:hypothetical protein
VLVDAWAKLVKARVELFTDAVQEVGQAALSSGETAFSQTILAARFCDASLSAIEPAASSR